MLNNNTFTLELIPLKDRVPEITLTSKETFVVLEDATYHIGTFHCNGYFYSHNKLVAKWRDDFNITIKVPIITHWIEK